MKTMTLHVAGCSNAIGQLFRYTNTDMSREAPLSGVRTKTKQTPKAFVCELCQLFVFAKKNLSLNSVSEKDLCPLVEGPVYGAGPHGMQRGTAGGTILIHTPSCFGHWFPPFPNYNWAWVKKVQDLASKKALRVGSSQTGWKHGGSWCQGLRILFSCKCVLYGFAWFCMVLYGFVWF